jgi:hypothetical protein
MPSRGPKIRTVEERRDLLDEVHRMIAAEVQHTLVTGPDRPQRTGRPPEVLSVTGTALSALLTEVTVVTTTRTRCFLVRVTETAAGRG